MTGTEILSIVVTISAGALAAVPLATLIVTSWRELGWKRHRELRDELRQLIETHGPRVNHDALDENESAATEQNIHLQARMRLVREAADLLDIQLADAAIRVARRKAKTHGKKVKTRKILVGAGYIFPALTTAMFFVVPFADFPGWLKPLLLIYFLILTVAMFMGLREAWQELGSVENQATEINGLATHLASSKALFLTIKDSEDS